MMLQILLNHFCVPCQLGTWAAPHWSSPCSEKRHPQPKALRHSCFGGSKFGLHVPEFLLLWFWVSSCFWSYVLLAILMQQGKSGGLLSFWGKGSRLLESAGSARCSPGAPEPSPAEQVPVLTVGSTQTHPTSSYCFARIIPIAPGPQWAKSTR